MGIVVLGLMLVIGFYGVLDKRFSEGGLYPHYASFRSDPLGTSAFYETLDRLPECDVSRNIIHLNTVQGLDENTALLMLGYPREGIGDLRAPIDSPVMEAVEKGARLVITINPELVPEKYSPVKGDEEDDWLERRRKIRGKRLRDQKDAEDEDEVRRDQKKKKKREKEEEAKLEAEIAASIGPKLTEKLGFAIARVEAFEKPERGWKLKRGRGASLEEGAQFPRWYSQYRFEATDDAWRIVASVKKQPVVIERNFGEGSVVLMTDSFFVSNESLHLGAAPEFLVWVLGGKKNVVFDETIHGTEESGGAMKLVRRHRLHGVFFGFLIFVGLWAWRSGSSLAPGSDDLDRGLVGAGGAVSGEETESGLIRLLRRCVSKSDLIDHCVEMWRESNRQDIPTEKMREVEGLVDNHRIDQKRFGVLSTYSAIVEALRRR
tara:strand:- start:773 stop:2071 length:1299 start_codon:yes stop_codon:yes gene_type:complete